MSTASGREASMIVQIITCRKSSDRRLAPALASLDVLDLACDVDVIDGYVAEDPVVDELYDPARNRRHAKRPISRTEVAVYASHRLAWQRLLDSGHAAALVLEDDFKLRDPDTVAKAVGNCGELLDQDRDIVKLFDFAKRSENRAAFSRRVAGIELIKWESPTAGMVGYLISRAGAEKFLSRKRVYRQVDEDTKYFWELGLEVWSVPGNPVVERSVDLGGSIVDAERDSMKTRSLGRSLWGNLITADRKIRTRYHLLRERMRQT